MNLSIKQAAEKAKVSIPTIHNWIKSGKLSATKQGKAWQISQTALEQSMNKPSTASLTEEAFGKIASQVVAELKPVLEQAFAIQQDCQAKNNELDGRIAMLEKELAEIKQSLGKQTGKGQEGKQQEAKQAGISQKASQDNKQNAEPVVRRAEQPDEEKAEKWLRENLEKWLDQPCSYGKAMGRTWRELAENKGEKINLKGIDSLPRAYLHAIENWQKCESIWTKTKAKVALEVVNKNYACYASA